MKKFIIATVVIFALALAGAYLYFYEGWGGDLFSKDGDVHTFTATEGRTILVDQGDGLKEFEIRGVDLGAGKPGHFATDYALDKETYLRWFAQIQDMGANTIRVYTLLGDAFYEAFYEYNHDNPHPLYLIHGVWLNDYAGYSHMDGFDADYQGKLESDTRTVIDAIHGQRMVELGRVAGTGSYRWDVSPWVLGYIVGVEWEPSTVAYTDMKYPDRRGFSGRYLYTTDDATPFETMLAELGDSIDVYKRQGLRVRGTRRCVLPVGACARGRRPGVFRPRQSARASAGAIRQLRRGRLGARELLHPARDHRAQHAGVRGAHARVSRIKAHGPKRSIVGKARCSRGEACWPHAVREASPPGSSACRQYPPVPRCKRLSVEADGRLRPRLSPRKCASFSVAHFRDDNWY